ncbi:alpha/beta fold hydrolase [Allosphingosinicella sp.]|jgi:pimeloyl-ACP methyl ester carboxylesterase|uniref:alpha/beta fold hydrolase n=1 Tax=Allosphingosinicella sp. TaxID=2823234 RepID=UPI002F25390E
MRRRHFLAGLGAAMATASCSPSAGQPARPFEPTRFSVEVRGTGPDVILIPGLTAGRDVWAGTVAAVPGYRYHLVQIGGMAGEPVRGNADGAIVQPLAEELSRYIASRNLRPAVVGHSMGGTLGMMVAARWPGRVGKLMVVDMLPQPTGLIGSSADRMRGLADSLRGIASSPGGRRLFGSLIGSFGTDSRSDPDVVGRALHELASIDLTPDLPRIGVPMTIVYASADARARASADGSYRQAYSGARGARFVRIDDSGHMIMFDQPARLHSAVREFLER